jgi:hypothetical protein
LAEKCEVVSDGPAAKISPLGPIFGDEGRQRVAHGSVFTREAMDRRLAGGRVFVET